MGGANEADITIANAHPSTSNIQSSGVPIQPHVIL
jgi:hypothetical protein